MRNNYSNLTIPLCISKSNISITNIRFSNTDKTANIESILYKGWSWGSMTQKQANFLFLLATIGWGASYLFTKFAVAEILPFALVAYRFSIAFVITFAIFYKKIIHTTKQTLLASFILGILLCVTFSSFGFAMQTANPASAGFLMATTVIFVPILVMIMSRKLASRQVLIGSVVTIGGLALFSLKGGVSMEIGNLLCLATAIFYAIHIVINNYFAKKYDVLQLGIYQLGFTAVLGVICMLSFEPITYPTTSTGWTSMLLLAIICTAFGLVVQSLAQGATTAEATGFIFSLEPIFAAIFAFLFVGEVLNGQEWLGAMLIFIGVLVANYTPKKQTQLA